MASATSLTTLEDEVNCPICQGILREPVTIDCGHNFCRSCLTRYCEIPGPEPGLLPSSQEQIHRCLEFLKNEREDIRRIQSREDQRIQVLLAQIATKREKVISEFEHMCWFLERQQYLLLTELEELGGDILKQKNEFECLVQNEICRFNALISELKEKLERPAKELLKDIRSTLIRCETRKCRKPEAVSPDLGERIRDFPQQALQLQKEIKMFLEKLLFELDYEPAHIFLDPQTAHPKLLLSEDLHQAQFSYKWQTSLDSPLRFDRAICVLAQAGFVGGRHTWVIAVDLAHGGSCTMGVVNQDVQRKGELKFRPEEGIWAVRLAWGFVSALGSFPTRLSLEENPRQIRVSLDYEVGWVTFSNATTQEPIYTFTTSFIGKIFPFFGLWGRGSSFSLNP
ncbi:tripartite motif-containing protein 10 isoform X2 [Macrotis lagotis]|uniref:tripartite motif-containing protein 10 isoform X2 n=1 Tax=Macrotis lagotis TaxID=92651 RepID=UPI003D68E8E7